MGNDCENIIAFCFSYKSLLYNTDYTNYIVQSRLRLIVLLICYIGITPGTMPG